MNGTTCNKTTKLEPSQSILLGEAAGVDSAAFGALQDKLAQPDACMNRQWPAGNVGHFEDLVVVHTRRNETGRHMNHQPKASEAAAPLEPAADVSRQADAFARDAVYGFAWL